MSVAEWLDELDAVLTVRGLKRKYCKADECSNSSSVDNFLCCAQCKKRDVCGYICERVEEFRRDEDYDGMLEYSAICINAVNSASEAYKHYYNLTDDEILDDLKTMHEEDCVGQDFNKRHYPEYDTPDF